MFGFINSARMKWKEFNFEFHYSRRKQIKWRQLNGIDLEISDELMKKSICRYIYNGIYETDEHKILTETFNADDTLLELGTGIGYNTIYCAKKSHNRVTSFEGNSSLIPLIKKNMKKNDTDFDVRNEILVSQNAEELTSTFNIAEEFWFSSLKTDPGARITHQITVPTCSVKQVISEVNPTYLLVDIEGGEEEFFRDSSFLANSSIKKILVELHPWAIGDEKCNAIITNILRNGFTMKIDLSPKHIMYFYK
ncbi:MAG: FkbM family methyltransferase [Chitinophagaceae bacterium]